MKKKLLFSFSAIITTALVTLLILFILFSFHLQRIRHESYLLQSRNAETLMGIQNLKGAIGNCADAFSDYVNTRNAYRLTDFYKELDNSLDAINTLKGLIDDDSSAYTLSAIEESFASYAAECQKTIELYELEGNDYYSSKTRADIISDYIIRYSDELLASVIERDALLLSQDARAYSTVLHMNLAFILFFIVLIVAIITLYALEIGKPLKILYSTALSIAEGNLEHRADINARDKQVNLLTTTFNDMADDIVKMMEDLRKKADAEKKLLEEQKRSLEIEAQLGRATFLALQTQTNPHFLFNTLNTIERTIQLGKTDDARRMLKSISALMRYNLSDGIEAAVLREEVEITEEYLSIQKIRFGERLNYSIDISTTLLDTLFMPRFTLQPLVENAIIHGLNKKEEGGNLLLKAEEDGAFVLLKIIDDGVGMDEKTINECLSRSWMESKHLGISNTMHRIELFTGRNDAFSIKSEVGKWTEITIVLKR